MFYFSNDEVSNKHIQPLAKKFIRTSIRLTIGHLKKYLRLKLNLPNKKEVSLTKGINNFSVPKFERC